MAWATELKKILQENVKKHPEWTFEQHKEIFIKAFRATIDEMKEKYKSQKTDGLEV